MNYTFHIKTIDSTLIEEVETDLDLTDAPFLVRGFRTPSSSTCTESELDQFWDIVDLIMTNNNLQIDEFVAVLRAIDENGELFGLEVKESDSELQ
jgi:hypothetical protein